jgi:SAM-dependent methyltransferase
MLITSSADSRTADAFSHSWENCFSKSPYTLTQTREWFHPVRLEEMSESTICELGCGNGGLLQRIAGFSRKEIVGVDLGNSVIHARDHFRRIGLSHVTLKQADIVTFSMENPETFDFVYCIGVIHHMKHPEEGFEAVIRATRPGGHFHCWVYGYEGNGMIRLFVEPLRRLSSCLPWWINKFGIALPLSVPFFALTQAVRQIRSPWLKNVVPLHDYLRWIADYPFAFHHHVAFDQLVSPQTTYIRRVTIQDWLNRKDIHDTYIISRNGNSWIFGGRKKE